MEPSSDVTEYRQRPELDALGRGDRRRAPRSRPTPARRCAAGRRADVQRVVKDRLDVTDEPLVVVVDLVAALEHAEDGAGVLGRERALGSDDHLAVVVGDAHGLDAVLGEVGVLGHHRAHRARLPGEQAPADVLDRDRAGVVVGLVALEGRAVVPGVAVAAPGALGGICVPDQGHDVQPLKGLCGHTVLSLRRSLPAVLDCVRRTLASLC
jgi:hypothetical protein